MKPFTFIFFLMSLKANAQGISGARLGAMASAGTAMEDVFSLSSNQAGIASLNALQLALAYEKKFYPTGDRNLGVFAVLPTKMGNLGFYGSHYGLDRVFSEIKTGFTFASFLSPKLSWATSLYYHRTSLKGYNSTAMFSFDIGFQYHLSEAWVWGLHIVNPIGSIINTDKAFSVPIKYTVGTRYNFSKQVLVAVEGEYDWNQYFDFRLGVEYFVLNWLVLRGGTSVNPFKRFGGAGFEFQNYKIDLASSVHPQLGVSPQISVSYGF